MEPITWAQERSCSFGFVHTHKVVSVEPHDVPSTDLDLGREDNLGQALLEPDPRVARILDTFVDSVEPMLDQIAADLTREYRQNIPIYDQVDEETIERNTRAALGVFVDTLRSPEPGASLREIAGFAREWADQRIPLELVAHSIQLAGRELFAVVREQAAARGLSAVDLYALQDFTWQWATAHAAAIHTVQQERAVTGATRRADFLRQTVAGTISAATLATEAPTHHLDPRHHYHVACFTWSDTSASSDLAAALRSRGATAQHPILDAVIDGRFVALLARHPEQVHPPQPVGTGPAVPLHDAPDAYQHALASLDIAEKHSRSGLVDLASLGPLPLLEQAGPAADMLDDKHLGPLRRRGRAAEEILDTVSAYLAHDRKVDDTANSLFVHRNTIRYRLTRFAELTGLDTDRTNDLVLAWWLLNRVAPPPDTPDA